MLEKKSRTDRERILDMARAAAAHLEPIRSRSIMGLMRERYRGIEPCCIEAEVFYGGYLDETGREYWSARLSDTASKEQLAQLLAIHASRSAVEFERAQRLLLAALAPIAWPADATSLLEHPVVRQFVPASLRAFLELQATPVCPAAAVAAPAIAQEPPEDLSDRPKFDRVKAKMLEAGPNVFGWVENMLAFKFDACRDTCRKARNELARDLLLDMLRTAGAGGLSLEGWNAQAKKAGIGHKIDLHKIRDKLLLEGLVCQDGAMWLAAS